MTETGFFDGWSCGWEDEAEKAHERVRGDFAVIAEGMRCVFAAYWDLSEFKAAHVAFKKIRADLDDTGLATASLDGHYTSQDYPVHLRRVRFRDEKTGKTLVFLTNQAALPALTICDLYKSRWQVELFFKWIKQHLRIKQFFGTSENAVKTQIWIAVSVYVLVAIVRKRLMLDVSLHTLMQVFSVTVFEKASIEFVVFQEADSSEYVMVDNQLNLFSS